MWEYKLRLKLLGPNGLDSILHYPSHVTNAWKRSLMYPTRSQITSCPEFQLVPNWTHYVPYSALTLHFYMGIKYMRWSPPNLLQQTHAVYIWCRNQCIASYYTTESEYLLWCDKSNYDWFVGVRHYFPELLLATSSCNRKYLGNINLNHWTSLSFCCCSWLLQHDHTNTHIHIHKHTPNITLTQSDMMARDRRRLFSLIEWWY